MVKKEISRTTKIVGKGTLEEITPDGFSIYDEKDGEETITFEELKLFVGKAVNFSFTLKEEEK